MGCSFSSTVACASCGEPAADSPARNFCGFCGEPIPAAVRWIGRTIAGRFEILDLIGEGGGGRVYVAEQAIGRTKRRVALKMLLPEHASNPEMIERFSRECEAVSVIEHTNVVRLYDFGEAEEGALYIAMELVPGRSLGALIADEGALEPRRALDLFAQICRGVSAVHDRDIIHRDLKVDNIMVVERDDEPEVVKLLDFGIAKSVGSSALGIRPLTRLGVVVGSPAYMSPEQFAGGELDARTDVYALGIVAYEMLTGVLPFEAEDVNGWAAQHFVAPPRPFDSTDGGRRVPAPVRNVIERAMAKNPADRPSTVRTLLREIEAAFKAATTAPAPVAPRLAPPPPPSPLPPHTSPRPRRSRVASAGLWTLVAVTACGAGSVAGLAAASSPRVVSYVSKSPPAHVAVAAPVAPSTPPAPAATAPEPPVVQPVPPLPPIVPPPTAPAPPSPHSHAKPAPPPKSSAKVDTTGCERAVRAATCDDARAGERTCPDTAGLLHRRAQAHANAVCGATDERHGDDPLPPLPTVGRPVIAVPGIGTISIVTSPG